MFSINMVYISAWSSPSQNERFSQAQPLLKLEADLCSSLQRKHTDFCNSLHLAPGTWSPLSVENYLLFLCVLEKPFEVPPSPQPVGRRRGLEVLLSGQYTQLPEVWEGCRDEHPGIFLRLAHFNLRNICQSWREGQLCIKYHCKDAEPRGGPYSTR